jgi:cobalt-zinc-cadmium efflux system outer membrane protein
MRIYCLWALAAAGAMVVTGCASVPRDRGAGEVDKLLAARGAPAAHWPDGRDAPPAATPPAERTLSLRQSLELAFSSSPAIREQYAELGLSAAETHEAIKLPELGLEYSRLAFDDDHAQVTRGVSVALADLLLLPWRSRLAGQNHEITRQRVAARLGELETQVQAAWFEYTAALQAAGVQARAARVSRASADYASSLHAAGNLPARALAQEQAAASSAAIEAARAEAHALESRARFATLVGLSVRDDWRLAPSLPALPADDALPADLARAAGDARPDIAAARREVDVLTRAWRISRAWRWLGEFDAGYEWEKDHGEKLRGPSFRLTLPLFHWNRGAVLRARAGMEGAMARRDALELGARNDVALGLDRLATTRRIAETYRTALLPQREAVSARTLEEVNFMLTGAFEALAARREQFAAYVEYVDAVRDYWLARADLRLASGGALPLATGEELLDLESPPANAAHDHGAHR